MTGTKSAIDALSYKELIALCIWNDPNGEWESEEAVAEHGERADEERLRDTVKEWQAEYPRTDLVAMWRERTGYGKQHLYGTTPEKCGCPRCLAKLAKRAAQISPSDFDGMIEDAMNAAIAKIQDALGIPSGDFAAHYFNGREGDKLRAVLNMYALAELDEAGREISVPEGR